MDINIVDERKLVEADLKTLGETLNQLRQQEASVIQSIHERRGILGYLKLLEGRENEPNGDEGKPQNRIS